MDPCVAEYIGENSIVGIIPNFTFDVLHLVCGSIGPFRAGIPIHVPLWLAIHLRKQHKCRLVPPKWMEVDVLNDLKEEEKNSKLFVAMPSEHYMVESQLILTAATEDVPSSEEIRTIVKDIHDIRESKLRTSINMFIKGGGTYAKLDNLTLLETHSVRPILPHGLDHIERYQKSAAAHERNSSVLANSLSNTSSFTTQ